MADQKQFTFEFQIASLKDRAFAYLRDWLYCAVITVIFIPIVYFHVGYPRIPTADIPFLILPAILIYGFLFDIILRRQTPGQLSRRLEIVTLSGVQPRWYHYLIRWVTRLFDFITLGLAIFLKIKGKRHRLLKDLLSGTIVIHKTEEAPEPTIKPDTGKIPKAPASLMENIAEASKNTRSIYLLYIGLCRLDRSRHLRSSNYFE